MSASSGCSTLEVDLHWCPGEDRTRNRGVQAHWPAWLEANVDHALATYMARGTLPPLAKEAMHVAVSMTNHCEY